LSAALKFGAIGIRTVWQASVAAFENSRSDETKDNIQTWQQELAWREFYQHCMYFFPELKDGAYRKEFKDFPWDNNDRLFQAWCEGKTGYPIVDAAMRQLNEIGWMHNRCRMIVASFLTKDLISIGVGEKNILCRNYTTAIFLLIMAVGNGVLLVEWTPNLCVFSIQPLKHKNSIPKLNISANGYQSSDR
jgi:hypothetical protein